MTKSRESRYCCQESIQISGGIRMPLVRISLLEGRSKSAIEKISNVVHQAMVETISVPPQDRFQLVTEHPKGYLAYDPDYLRSEEHTSELQSRSDLVCRLLLEKK